MERMFIIGQIEALKYYMATTKPRRMDLRNTYWKLMLMCEIEIQRLNEMLINDKMRYRIIGVNRI